MRLTSLQLPTEALRLDDLSSGLNVAYAPAAEKRRLIPAAVRGLLFADAEDVPDARLDVQTNWGGFALGMADAESTEERGAWLRARLAEIISPTTFAAIYTPRLGDPLALDAAMREVCGDEFARQRQERLESLLQELEETRPFQGREAEVAELRTRETDLVVQLEQVKGHGTAGCCGEHHRDDLLGRRDACRARLAALQERIARLTARIQSHRQQISTRWQPKYDLVTRRVAKVEKKLDHVRRQGDSLKQRAAELLNESQVRTASSHYDRLMEMLNRETRRLDSYVTLLMAQPAAEGSWSAAVDRIVPRLRQLNQKLQALCARLSDRRKWLAEHAQLSAKLEREHVEIERLRRSLSVRLQQLAARQATLRRRLEQQAGRVELSGDLDRLLRSKAKLERRAERGRQVLARLEQQWREWERNHAGGVVVRPSEEQLHAELAQVRARLQELELAERSQAGTLLEKLKGFIHKRPAPSVLVEASRILHQLSDGELVGIRPGNSGRDTLVEQPRGKTVSCDVLSRSERVCVHLALCLAAAAEAARQGSAFPLILNDATRHFPPARLRSVIELLRGYCRASGQVVLLTSQQHVATLCRSLGAASYWLARPPAAARPALNIHEPESDDETPAEPAARVRVRSQDWDCEEFPGELTDRKSRFVDQPSAAPVRAMEEKAEAQPAVYPREVSPSTPEPSERAVPKRHLPPLQEEDLDVCPVESLRVTGHYLELCDRISDAPFLTRRVSRWLEAAGLYTVANLLHAEPARLMEKLAGTTITVADLRQWQSQFRLMCGVRRLRAYDAKILVACGITTPEQLADIRPEELHDMIEAFVATPEGSRVVRSGNEQEIKRITGWIRGVQHAKRRRGSPLDEATVRPASSSSSKLPKQPKERSGDSAKESTKRRRGERLRRKGSEQPQEAEVLPLNFHLEPSSHVEAAPTIGPVMAKRLEAVGVVTVGNLLSCDCDEVADRLGQRRVTGRTIRDWQRQAGLVCRIPELRGHDAQILVACDIETPEQLAALTPDHLYSQVMPFVKSKAGQRVLRGAHEPTLAEVGNWIRWARHARKLDAA